MIDIGVASDAAPVLALDIGATKAEVALVDAEGALTRRERIDWRVAPGDLVDPLVVMVEGVARDSGASRLGVGCAGPMTKAGETVSPLNLPAWRDFALRATLRDRLGLDVFVDGDARALALAEGVFGSARGDRSFLSMVVSSGVGGGLVLDGRLVDGATGNAGHVGHLTVVPDGRECACGSRGCLEAEASGMAIEAVSGRPPSEADVTTRQRVATLVGRAVGSLSAVLDFTRCYVAGSVALGFGSEFFSVATQSAREVARISYAVDIEVAPSGLGADGPLLGAALVAWRGEAA